MKDDRILGAEVRAALDDCLSGIDAMPSLRYDIMQKVRGETVVKKKLSVGFVLAMVLVLIVMGAIAAVLLTGREFVEQELAPMVSESASERWTQEELDEILRIASENGLVLDDDVLLRLRQGDGEYKEELMRIFVKLDLGFYPGTWPIEDQAWYDALLVECGLKDVQTQFVPEGDEISSEQVVEIAIAHIKATFGDPADFTDESIYRRFVEYRQMINGGDVIPRKWYIWYEALLPTLNSYMLTIAPDGTIEEVGCEPRKYGENGPENTDEVFTYYKDTYGRHYEWPQEVWTALQHDLMQAVEGTNRAETEAILRQQYGTPDAQAISKDKAVEAAASAIEEKGLLTQEGLPLTKATLEADYTAHALYLIGTSQPVWKIRFVKNGPIDLLHAEVNAYTGDVENITHDDRSNGSFWFEPYILFETLGDDQGELPANG